MSDADERTFVVTQEQLLELLGDAARPLAAALADCRARSRAHPSHAERIVLTIQGDKVIEVESPRKWRLLTRKVSKRDD